MMMKKKLKEVEVNQEKQVLKLNESNNKKSF